VNREEKAFEFEYMMLSRLKMDMDNFIDEDAFSYKKEKSLWALNVDDQIDEMKRLWNILPVKPEWLSMEKILEYEREGAKILGNPMPVQLLDENNTKTKKEIDMSQNLLAGSIDDLKEKLIEGGFRIIQKENAEYFNFEKDNQFGYFQSGTFGASLASSYHASKNYGIGATYKAEMQSLNLNDFNEAVIFRARDTIGAAPYKDMKDFLSNQFDILRSRVYDKSGSRKAIDLLDDYYVYISPSYSPTIKKDHNVLMSIYDSDSQKNAKKAIFQIKGGDLEVVNHNLNLFKDSGLMQGFKSRILREEMDLERIDKKLLAVAEMVSPKAVEKAKEMISRRGIGGDNGLFAIRMLDMISSMNATIEERNAPKDTQEEDVEVAVKP